MAVLAAVAGEAAAALPARRVARPSPVSRGLDISSVSMSFLFIPLGGPRDLCGEGILAQETGSEVATAFNWSRDVSCRGKAAGRR